MHTYPYIHVYIHNARAYTISIMCSVHTSKEYHHVQLGDDYCFSVKALIVYIPTFLLTDDIRSSFYSGPRPSHINRLILAGGHVERQDAHLQRHVSQTSPLH